MCRVATQISFNEKSITERKKNIKIYEKKFSNQLNNIHIYVQKIQNIYAKGIVCDEILYESMRFVWNVISYIREYRKSVPLFVVG